MVKTCSCCSVERPVTEFWRDARQRDGRKAICAPCGSDKNKAAYRRDAAERVQRTKDWRLKNMPRHRLNTAAHRRRLKHSVMQGYGGKCTCCGETEIAFLTIEHLNGGGRKHFKEAGSSQGVYRDVIARGFPPEFTVLCMNCNHAKRNGHVCPHEQARALLAKLDGDI